MRNGIISNLTREYLEQLISTSITLSEILRKLNLDTSSGNFRTLKRKMKKENVNWDHIKNGPGYDSSKIGSFKPKIPLDEILIVNSEYIHSTLKKRLINEGLLTLICSLCGLESLWNNEPLTLQLDHINGISNDNRIENLRILCPNCHSQTPTFVGRNKPKKIKEKTPPRPTKIKWPADNDLILLVKNTNYVLAAEILGVSDNAIRARLKRNGYNPKDFT